MPRILLTVPTGDVESRVWHELERKMPGKVASWVMATPTEEVLAKAPASGPNAYEMNLVEKWLILKVADSPEEAVLVVRECPKTARGLAQRTSNPEVIERLLEELGEEGYHGAWDAMQYNPALSRKAATKLSYLVSERFYVSTYMREHANNNMKYKYLRDGGLIGELHGETAKVLAENWEGSLEDLLEAAETLS